MKQNLSDYMPSMKEKTLNSLKSKPKRNQFLVTLYKALEKKEYEEGMCWDTDGLAIILKKPDFIGERILNEQFGGMKFASFIRQLSYYGFKRLSRRAKVKVYFHEQFQKGRQNFVKQIKRNNKEAYTNKAVLKKIMSQKKEFEKVDVIESMQLKISNLEAELEKLRAENLALKYSTKSISNKTENEKSSVPMCQTFFNPQIGDQINYMNPAQMPIQGENQTNFMTLRVIQPENQDYQTKIQKKFDENVPYSQQDDYLTSHPIDVSSDNRSFLRQDFEESFGEDFWRFEDIVDDELF